MQKVLFLALVSMLCGFLSRAEGAEIELKGVMFADYYYVTSGSWERENGFRFRRIYLTYDLRWDDRFSGRVRLEANGPGFGSKEKMEPFVKHAFLRYRNRDRTLTFGLSGTPTWNVSERAWGYRSISKTIMDLRKIGSSADLGIAFGGKLDDAGKVSARVTIGNGSGQRAEGDAEKKTYALLHLRPAGSFETTAYLDWEDKTGGKIRSPMPVS